MGSRQPLGPKAIMNRMMRLEPWERANIFRHAGLYTERDNAHPAAALRQAYTAYTGEER